MKVLKIDSTTVILGLDNGKIKKLPLKNFTVIPEVGDTVSCYKDENGEYIYSVNANGGSRKENKKKLKFYHKWWFIILCLICVWPLGIFLVLNKYIENKKYLFGGIATLFIFLISVVGVLEWLSPTWYKI